MTLSDRLSRYKDLAVFIAKYGRADVVAQARLEPIDGAEPASAPEAEAFARDLEALGPTFIKLGQLLSTRADLLPQPYLDALARLQDDIEPFPYADVERIVQEELGVRLSKAFDAFDAVPIAAASLGQVHRAVLRGGRDVAVKVQRPDVRERVLRDLNALDEVASLFDRRDEDYGSQPRGADGSRWGGARRPVVPRVPPADPDRWRFPRRSPPGQRPADAGSPACVGGSGDGRPAVVDVQEQLFKLLLAIGEGRGDEAATVAIALSERRDDFDELAMRRNVVNMVSRYHGTALKELNVGRVMLEVVRTGGQHGLISCAAGCGRPPPPPTSGRRRWRCGSSPSGCRAA